MSIKLPYLIAILLVISVAGCGISYFVFFTQAAPVKNVPLANQNIQEPRERLPTKGGQQMKLEF